MGVYVSFVILFRDIRFDGVDQTNRFIIAARRCAEAALHETSPKLTALEKGILIKLKPGESKFQPQDPVLRAGPSAMTCRNLIAVSIA